MNNSSAIAQKIDAVLEPLANRPMFAALRAAVAAGDTQLRCIEAAFDKLHAGPHDEATLRRFFHNWALTNNSAITVAGLGNRLTMMIRDEDSEADLRLLARSVASFNRIVDEDLAVVGNVLHSELYYRMATGITGGDQWQSRAYLDENAKAFKAWKDSNSLQDPDLTVGLLTTLCHEIYTHGEVEHVWPGFVSWLERERPDVPVSTLAWIKVHTGPTEKDHFFHAVDALDHWAAATKTDLDAYDVGAIMQQYLERKAAAMDVLVNTPAVVLAPA